MAYGVFPFRFKKVLNLVYTVAVYTIYELRPIPFPFTLLIDKVKSIICISSQILHFYSLKVCTFLKLNVIKDV